MHAIKILTAIAFAVLPSQVQAQRMVCGPNGCTYVRAPIASAVRPGVTVYRQAPARYQSVERVHYRRGLFGRRVPVRSGRVYVRPAASSYGSSGSSAVYQSSGSHGGYTAPPPVSYGSAGGSGQSASTAEAPAASLPAVEDQSQTSVCPCGPDCQCGPSCDCEAVAIAKCPPLPVIASMPELPVIASIPRAEPDLTMVAMR